ncbi:MAG: type II secretion system protein [Fimbriimonadaceae bacterium]|nr:type II secretion system protein [Fimbriimonadaceae bacterium]QYK57678.1 MAG: type II secretion system protein [Fimbriimonadaceae bacterium]
MIQSKSRSRGLTIIELLVTITLVVLLAGLTATGILQAVKHAKKSACLNNLVTIGKALEIYVSDHDGYFPSPPWFAQRGRRPMIQEFKDSLMPYGTSETTFYSPSDPYARQEVMGEMVDRRLSSYAMHFHVLFKSEFTADGSMVFAPARVSDPSDFMVFLVDTILRFDESTGRWNRWSPQGQTVNALYLDGRAKAIPFPEPELKPRR